MACLGCLSLGCLQATPLFSEAALLMPAFSVARVQHKLQHKLQHVLATMHVNSNTQVYACILYRAWIIYLKHRQSAVFAVTRAHHDFQVWLRVALELLTDGGRED